MIIPTRTMIDQWKQDRISSIAQVWMYDMRDEIDRLTDANTELRDKVDDTDGRIAAMEIHGNSADHWYRKATAYKNAFSERDAALAEVTKLRADLDRANTEWDRIRAVTRQIIEVTGAPGPCSMEDAVGFIIAEVGRLRADLEIALAKATTPAPEREAKIRAWETCALAIKDDGDYHPIDVYLVTLHEIRNAVALMRSAGDGKALLRELRAWICGEWSSALAFGSIRRILDGIDEMLAQPAPVEQPAAAVPDDTRELVAQLADAIQARFGLVMPSTNLDFRSELERIAAKLRGGA